MSKKAKESKSCGCSCSCKVSIVPMEDRLLVQPLDAPEMTAGGILLPDTAQEKPQKGKVISVGPGALQENGKRAPMSLACGDFIIYGKYSGSEIEVEGEKFLIMRESDVLAVVRD